MDGEEMQEVGGGLKRELRDSTAVPRNRRAKWRGFGETPTTDPAKFSRLISK